MPTFNRIGPHISYNHQLITELLQHHQKFQKRSSMFSARLSKMLEYLSLGRKKNKVLNKCQNVLHDFILKADQ